MLRQGGLQLVNDHIRVHQVALLALKHGLGLAVQLLEFFEFFGEIVVCALDDLALYVLAVPLNAGKDRPAAGDSEEEM